MHKKHLRIKWIKQWAKQSSIGKDNIYNHWIYKIGLVSKSQIYRVLKNTWTMQKFIHNNELWLKQERGFTILGLLADT